MNKLSILLFALFALVFTSCSDDDENTKAENQQAIETYLATNNLTAESSVSGLYWIIEQQGNGEFPADAYVNVTVDYTLYLPDGTEKETGTIDNKPLKNYILGWQEGIPKFSKGGSGKLLVPSHLAYGDREPSNNSFLIFDIELVDFE